MIATLTFSLVCLMGGATSTIKATQASGSEQVFHTVVAVMTSVAGALLVLLTVDILRDYGRSRSLYDREESGLTRRPDTIAG